MVRMMATRKRRKPAKAAVTVAPAVKAATAEVTLPPVTQRHPGDPPLISVVVVTYQSKRHLPDLLQSLRAQSLRDFELIQVDSASKDQANEIMASRWPSLRQTRSAENLGYRRGNQLGMEQARGQFVVLLNDDVELHPRLLEELVRAAGTDDRIAVVAPAILVHGAKDRLNAAGSDLMPAGFYAARGKNHPYGNYCEAQDIAAASGCCLLVRREFLERSGGFAPVFDTLPSGWHASLEDLDLCWRAWAEGWRVCYQPNAVLWHKYVQKGLDPARFASIVGGRLLFVWMNFPARLLIQFGPGLVATEIGLLLGSIMAGSRYLRVLLRCWYWAWRNRRRLNELRRVREGRRITPETTLLGLFRAALVPPPVVRQSFPLRAAASVWFAMNALCLGWPFHRGLRTSACVQSGLRGGTWYLTVKRACDATAAACLLVPLAPLLILLALMVRVALGSPVFFRQTRIGFQERPFTLFKFRSMRDGRDETGNPLADEERLTAFGRWLRSWSLDELPQLWNVLRGDMSFIGPRPLLPEYLPRYTAEHRARHSLRPGLSGLAQVNGRNASSWRKRLDLDCVYVRNVSPALDFKIAWQTVIKLLRREGIAYSGAATMPEFRGLQQDA